MGRHHAKAAVAAGASIAAIVDQNGEAAASLARSFPGATVETCIERALASTSPGVAHICTPLPTHGPLGELVAGAGLHALVEKPLAATGAEAHHLHDRFARAGKLACPTHQYAFQRSVARAADWLQGAGTLRRIAFDICSAGAANGLDPDEVVADILPHPLSMVQKLLPSVDLGTLAWSCIRSSPGEWVVTAPIAGAMLIIQISMGGRPTRFLTRLTADAGSIELDNFHDYAVVLPGAVSRRAKIAQPFIRNGLGMIAAGWNLTSRAARGESAYPGLRTLVEQFYTAVRTGSPSPITAQDSIAVAEARDRIVALAHG
jgi:predicted dehydrogenase